jgi:predicted kinase
MLVSFQGLPATGKSTIARLLARRTGASVLRIDLVDQKLIEIGFTPTRDESYRICHALAEDNLRLGRIVISDCVNDRAVTRDDWRAVAARAGAPCLEVEVICSDEAEHRRRAETRAIDIPGLVPPSWEKIRAAARESEPWTRERLTLDTAKISAEDAADEIERAMARLGGGGT